MLGWHTFTGINAKTANHNMVFSHLDERRICHEPNALVRNVVFGRGLLRALCRRRAGAGCNRSGGHAELLCIRTLLLLLLVQWVKGAVCYQIPATGDPQQALPNRCSTRHPTPASPPAHLGEERQVAAHIHQVALRILAQVGANAEPQNAPEGRKRGGGEREEGWRWREGHSALYHPPTHRPPSLACCSATAAIWRPLPTLQRVGRGSNVSGLTVRRVRATWAAQHGAPRPCHPHPPVLQTVPVHKCCSHEPVICPHSPSAIAQEEAGPCAVGQARAMELEAARCGGQGRRRHVSMQG